jgi:plasmid maintenance system antidote protein VapI
LELFGEPNKGRTNPNAPNRLVAGLLGISYSHARKIASGNKNVSKEIAVKLHNELHRRRALDLIEKVSG